MDNALYYTFSTIAQTLAAAVAFLGAFALYRLQVIASTLEDLGTSVIQPYLPDDKAQQFLAHERYEDLHLYIHTEHPHNNGAALNAYQIAQRASFARYVHSAQHVRTRLAWTLATTVLTIVAAVVVLPLTPVVVRSYALTCTVVVGGLLAFGVCLCMHGLFVYRALK